MFYEDCVIKCTQIYKSNLIIIVIYIFNVVNVVDLIILFNPLSQ